RCRRRCCWRRLLHLPQAPGGCAGGHPHADEGLSPPFASLGSARFCSFEALRVSTHALFRTCGPLIKLIVFRNEQSFAAVLVVKQKRADCSCVVTGSGMRAITSFLCTISSCAFLRPSSGHPCL